MSTYTPLLQFIQPSTGEYTGTWGSVINNSITALVEDAIAKTTSFDATSSATWTLSVANGATDEARCAALRVYGTPASGVSIVAPANSKLYVIINACGQTVTVKTSTSTGVTIPAGKTSQVVYNTGTSDFVELAASSSANLWGGTTGAVPYQSGVGTTTFLSPGTANYVLTSNGAGLAPSYQPSSGSITLSTRTSNTTLTSSDKGSIIKMTSAYNQVIGLASTLGAGFYCYIENASSGDGQLTCSGSDTVDGLTSYYMYPSEMRLLICTGTTFYTYVIKAFLKEFTSTGTFYRPPGYSMFSGYVWGGGGGGGKTGTSAKSGTGGGGGACNPFTVPYASIAASSIFFVGAGGIGSSTSGVSGGTGGVSEVPLVGGGKLINAYGGGGGIGSTSTNYWVSTGGGVFSEGSVAAPNSGFGAPGGRPYTTFYAYVTSTSYTSTIAIPSDFGGAGVYTDAVPGFSQGASYGIYGGGLSRASFSDQYPSLYGGGGGGGLYDGVSTSSGGTSVFGGHGGAAASSSNGTNGSSPGGGGGATHTGTKGGDGGAGLIRIWGIV